ncbi:MAG TPA: type III-A CRISPR-associated protein Cas10/Csm1 [Chloroflexi bacterium]|nr:type III-A CRISPR-associated protein Cas10/Csm1 [Chloroflexota bacterium]
MGNETIALAGLLHDIGKLMLRASVAGRYTWERTAQGDFGYKHAMLSATFVEELLPTQWRKEVLGPVGYHHKPQSRRDRIVQVADHLSAAERNDGLRDDQPRVEHPRQLLSIFCQLRADEQTLPADQRRYLPLQPLRLEEDTLFPKDDLSPDEVWRSYETLWNTFRQEAELLRDAHAEAGDLRAYLESMLLLLQRYTWCVPSAYYGSLPDISLYDHSRMTAALAAVLDRPDVDEAWLKQLDSEGEESQLDVALLVGGDVSGVQDFIYTITARGATPSLRGRSFYLQLLTEAIARYVLRRLKLPITNLIYVGGGNFYLLARPDDLASLTEIQREISYALLQHHRGALYVAVAGLPLRGVDFFGGEISKAWGRLHERIQQAKLRRFSELEAAELAQLFVPLDHGGHKEQQCQVCGLEHPGTKAKRASSDAEDVYKCPSCLAFEELGDDLRRARWLRLTERAPAANPLTPDLTTPPGSWRDVLAAFEMEITLFDKAPNAAQSDARSVLLALDDDALTALKPAAQTAVGRRLFVNTTPILTFDERQALMEDKRFPDVERRQLPPADRVKPFSVLEHWSHGIQRLGVLRMDVDNLGALFQEGLGKQATLSRVAMLSFAISLYFEGWVAKLAEAVNQATRRPPEQGGRLYAIYAGGDDLFFVGSWDAVVELAVAVRRDLTRYAAEHPGIHASGGIALVGGKYPLYQAARDAGDAEEQAKSLRWWDGVKWQRKDAICFLNEPLPWTQFGKEAEDAVPNYATVHGLMHELVRLSEHGAPKALARQLTDFYGEYRTARNAHRRVQADSDWANGPQTVWGRWMWRITYTLRRMEERNKQNTTVKDGLAELSEQVKRNNYQMVEPLGVAARWAELLLRGD